MEIKELDVVALTDDLPEEGLEAGAVGTVVHLFTTPGTAYEVEFVGDDGRTIATATLQASQITVLPE